MPNRRYDLLRTPLFIGALLLLLLNDFYLKAAFHNALTGKLSDFAGLFVFAVFWIALFPRFRGFVLAFTAAFFTFWKLPVSTGFVDALNSVLPLHIGRVCDVTDLSALAVLPAAAWFTRREKITFNFRFLHPVVPVLVCCFAFMATSKDPADFRQDIDKHYQLYSPQLADNHSIELLYDGKRMIGPTMLEAGWNKDFILLKRGNYTDAQHQVPSVREYYIIEKSTFGKDDLHMYYTEAEFNKARLVLDVPPALGFEWKGYTPAK
jgi:hypothetical protein